MEDVQMTPASVPLGIDRVGVKQLHLPIVIRDRDNGRQHTTATVEISVDLPSRFKGTHMSRFVEALEHWNEDLTYESLKRLLEDVKNRLGARKAHVRLQFPYFVCRRAPATSTPGLMAYDCSFSVELAEGKPRFCVQVEVPVMTVCPCSKAISAEGAHSQRTLVRIAAHIRRFCWLEEFIDIAEAAGSSPAYTLLKREDEKHVTERAFAHPAFVEDVVRATALRLMEHAQVEHFRVEVESLESIHAHNAFACIEHTNSVC